MHNTIESRPQKVPRYLALCLALVFSTAQKLPAQNPDDGKNGTAGSVAREWVSVWGDKWWERYHRELDAQYPGGRSNHYHDQYIAEAMKGFADTAWTDWQITNKHYLYEGDWFAVEWFYQSTQKSTGLVQVETTIAFGRIQDDHLITWIEYFDDMVGRYQAIGAMPLFDKENEAPFPWPENTALTRKYRP